MILEKTEPKKAFSISAFSVSHVIMANVLFSRGPAFNCPPLAIYGLTQDHLAFDIPHQIQFQQDFGFSDCIPAGLDSISVLLSGYPSLLPRSVCLSFVLEFPCLPMQASCHFYLTSCSTGFTALEFGGADPGMLTRYLGPLFPPGLYPMGLYSPGVQRCDLHLLPCFFLSGS